MSVLRFENFYTPHEPALFTLATKKTHDTNALAADVLETPDSFEVQVDVPGVAADAISISVLENVLDIKVDRVRTSSDSTQMLSSERVFGNMHRKLRLPKTADGSNATSCLTNGVLTIRFPKKEEAQCRVVPIQCD